jgi:hypothetical protein
MPPTGKRIVHVHINGQIIRTTADHTFYVGGQKRPGRHKERVFALHALRVWWKGVG